jgi:hypothetical protein
VSTRVRFRSGDALYTGGGQRKWIGPHGLCRVGSATTGFMGHLSSLAVPGMAGQR